MLRWRQVVTITIPSKERRRKRSCGGLLTTQDVFDTRPTG